MWRDEHLHFASLMALYAESKRDSSKRAQSYSPHDFMPDERTKAQRNQEVFERMKARAVKRIQHG